jgi:predicted nucleic acid-binding protein
MRVIFADAVYWIAITNPRDALHRRAIEIAEQLGVHRIVTSEMVCVELLNILSGHGSHFRRAAARLVQRLIDSSDIEVVPQTTALFRESLSVYRDRLDKNWSLTDCASFVIMDQRQIVEVLTYDQHFVQMGYRALLRSDS